MGLDLTSICRLHVAANAHTRLSAAAVAADPEPTATDNAAQNTARRAAGHAARHTADDATRQHPAAAFFLNHFNFLRDDGGSHQLAGLNQARDGLDNPLQPWQQAGAEAAAEPGRPERW